MRHRATVTRARARSTAALGAVVLLAGCVSIPTSGPIGEGSGEVAPPGAAIPLAADDPTPGAAPEQIVNEFLRAGAAGLYDDFGVARKFLTVTASSSWDEKAQVLVYQGEPDIELQEDGASVVVTVRLSAVVDGAGRYTELVPGSVPHERTFQLMRDGADQWRISALEDGVLMNSANFQSQFRQAEIYFATPDLTQLVPEVRWFASRRVETSAVAALLEGPSPWLRDAVRTGAPEGSRLPTDAVTVTDGVAVVPLAADARLGPADRELFQAQLEATLGQLAGRVNRVEVTVGGVPWEAGDVPLLARDVRPESGPYVIFEDQLAVVERREPVPLDDVASLEDLDASSPAISEDLRTRVVLSGSGSLLLLPEDAAPPIELVSGADLLAPSVDRFGWVWTGERRSTGELVAVDSDGRSVDVLAEWLAEREVRSIRVARDGTRIAVAYSVPGEAASTVEVAGVVRDEDGTPQLLTGDRLGVGGVLQDVVEVAWVDDSTLAVLGTSAASAIGATGAGSAAQVVHTVPLGGPTDSLDQVDDAVGIAAGGGDRIHVAVEDEVLYLRQNASWVVVARDVRDPVFPG